MNNNVLELRPTDSHKSFYGKAYVLINGEERVLYSYGTKVCSIIGGKLVRHWYGWSATTGRHIKAFCDTFGITYGGKKDWDKL